MSTIVAHHYPYVIGVDTHAATHTFAVLTSGGEHLDTQTFPTTPAGISRALAWAGRRTDGDVDILWVIEGIGSYGAELTKAAQDTGYPVVEAANMSHKSRRGIGKADPIDAQRIAEAVLPLSVERLRKPRDNQGIQAALKTLLAARDHISRERTKITNALTSLLRSIDLGVDARRAPGKRIIQQIGSWRTRNEAVEHATARTEAIRLAKRFQAVEADLKANDAHIAELVAHSPAAGLTQETGIGPFTAATALVAWGYPGRLRNEAAFAALAGTSPLQASSGKTIRHRLNRGGDRKLNRALSMATMHRMRFDPETRNYAEKRRAEGRTDREIRRSLKRYLARRIYRHLNHVTSLD